jgi:hypothetical protein
VLGDNVKVGRDKTKITVTSEIPMSKRYLKYLTKKYLKKVGGSAAPVQCGSAAAVQPAAVAVQSAAVAVQQDRSSAGVQESRAEVHKQHSSRAAAGQNCRHGSICGAGCAWGGGGAAPWDWGAGSPGHGRPSRQRSSALPAGSCLPLAGALLLTLSVPALPLPLCSTTCATGCA